MKRVPVEEIVKIVRENNNIVFYQDIYTSIGFSGSSFNKWYPEGSEDREFIDSALEVNRTATKKEIRNRLLESKNTAALLALYRLLATPEERNILNQYKVEELEAKKTDNNIELVIN
jgi:hypothetical protein